MLSRVILVAGARPNFMKVAPLMRALSRKPESFEAILVHTGQHYDFDMSDVFFRDLDMPRPRSCLNVGPGTHAAQTAKIMIAFEEVMLAEKPDLVVVVGDVNSTLACALVSAKLGVMVAHVEAGLRSFDRGMPEEINRVVTDAISDLHFVSEPSGMRNLRRAGVPKGRAFLVGNLMIDTLVASMPKIEKCTARQDLGLAEGPYAVVTLHRPANVDSRDSLEKILLLLGQVADRIPIVYPLHPRTRQRIRDCGLETAFSGLRGLRMVPPMGYVDFMALVQRSALVITDSGGIQEETTALHVPCLTMRENTERPVTVTQGTNRLVGTDEKALLSGVAEVLAGRWKQGKIPRYWDGRASERVVAILTATLEAGGRPPGLPPRIKKE